MRNNKNTKFKRTEIGMIPSSWEAVYIGNNIEIQRGGSPRPIEKYLTNSIDGVNWIKIGDTNPVDKYIKSTKEKITKKGAMHSREVHKGEFLLSNSMSYGRPYILNIDGYIHDGWLVLRHFEDTFNIDYLYYYLSYDVVKKQYDNLASGSGVKNLNKDIIKKVIVAKPLKPEQEKIANALTRIDNLIEDYEKLIKKKEKIKQGLMQNLLTGKVRLKGFKDTWCKNRIKEIYTITRGQVLSTKKISKTISGINCYPVYSSQTANNGLLGYYDKYLFDTCITWTTDGENAGTVKYREGKFYSTNVNGVLISKDNLCNECMSEIINMNTSNFIVRNGNPKLMNNVMAEIEICYPKDIKEQYAISQILINADNEISDLKLKLDKIKNIKKGMMDNLLTGKIRL